MWEFCGNVEFPQSFGQIAPNSAETVPFHKISNQEIRWNFGILHSDLLSLLFTLNCYVPIEDSGKHGTEKSDLFSLVC